MPAFEAIASTTLGSTGTVTFSSIPDTYEHLQLRFYARSNVGGASTLVEVRLNNDSNANYYHVRMIGDGSAVGGGLSNAETFIYAGSIPASTATSNIYGCSIIDILDYTSTNKYKNVKAIGGNDRNGSGISGFFSGVWLSTSAITRIDIVTSCIAGSVFSLYGLRSS